MEPILRSYKILATVCALSLSTQQAGSRLMISLIFTGSPPRRHQGLSLPRDLDLVDDLSIAGVGLRDTQRKVMLLFAIDRTRQNHRVLIDMNSDVAGAEHGFRIETLLNLLLHFGSGQPLRRRFLVGRHLLPWRPVLRKCRWRALWRCRRRRLSRLLGEHCHC